MPIRRLLRFGKFELDSVRAEVRRDGHPVALTPQGLGLLSYLIDHRDRFVSRDELLDQVWGDVVVSYGALSTAIYELRTALRDDERDLELIRTRRGAGFRFVADVEEARAVDDVAARESTAAGSDVPFVGRRELLERLSSIFDLAAAGRGCVILIEGEAGIGKTSLAQRFAAEIPNARVYWGRCYEHEGAPPFWPWRQVLRELVRNGDPTELRRLFGPQAAAALIQVVPEARGIFPPRRTRLGSPAEARFQLFDAVATLLRTESRDETVVIIVDDVHWADQASLLLLEFLVAELGRSRVLLIATYRGEETSVDDALTPVLAAISRSAHCERLRLTGLDRDEVRLLLTAVTGAEPPAAVVDTVRRRTEGNPLFVKELARQLDTDEMSITPAAATPKLPSAVREVIRRRLSRLSAATHEMLGVASVLGQELRLDVLRRVCDTRSTFPTAWLEEAINAQVLTTAGQAPGRVRFTHALFQEALSAGVNDVRRSALHLRAGEALESMTMLPAGADLSALAHHFSEALLSGGDATKAVTYCMAAAQAAGDMLAYEEAVRLFQRAIHALECTGKPDPTAYTEALLGLGTAQNQAGAPTAARDIFARAVAVARRSGAPDLLARAALGYAAARDASMRLDSMDARRADRRGAALLAEALAGIEAGSALLRARLLAALAIEAGQVTLAEKERMSSEALEIAARLGDPTLIAEVVSARREVLWAPENVELRLAMADQIVALAQQTDEREIELRGRAWRLTDLLELSKVPQVKQELDVCERLAEEIEQPKYSHHVLILRATLALLEGRFDDAERLSSEAVMVGRRMNSETAEMLFGAQIIGIRREQGRLDEIVDLVRDAADRRPAPILRSALAYVLGELDRLDEARAEFEAVAVDDFAAFPRDRNWLAAVIVLAETCVRLGDRARARTLYELLSPFAGRNIVSCEGGVSCGAASHNLGDLAGLLGRWEEAERHFEAALALNERLGALAYLGQIKRAYAQMLLARDQPGDRDRALTLLREAQATAERYGAGGLRRRVLAIRERAGDRESGAPVEMRTN